MCPAECACHCTEGSDYNTNCLSEAGWGVREKRQTPLICPASEDVQTIATPHINLCCSCMTCCDLLIWSIWSLHASQVPKWPAGPLTTFCNMASWRWGNGRKIPCGHMWTVNPRASGTLNTDQWPTSYITKFCIMSQWAETTVTDVRLYESRKTRQSIIYNIILYHIIMLIQVNV